MPALMVLGAVIAAIVGAGVGVLMHALDRIDGGDALPAFQRYELLVDDRWPDAVRDVLRGPT